MRSLVSTILMSLVALSTIASCGSSDGKDTDKFVGTWKFTSGTSTVNCPGLAADTQPVTGNITVSKGATSDLVVVKDDCSLKLSLAAATTADALPSQSCTTVDATGTEVDTFSSVVFSTSDGATAHLSMTLTAALTGGGSSLTCTVTQSADLQKL
jgi:hypothetical protein